jgi:hypothetical protein
LARLALTFLDHLKIKISIVNEHIFSGTNEFIEQKLVFADADEKKRRLLQSLKEVGPGGLALVREPQGSGTAPNDKCVCLQGYPIQSLQRIKKNNYITSTL